MKKPRTQFQIQEQRKKKTPTYTHFLSFAQTHSKKQHPNLKCNNTNNTNNTSLSLSLKNAIPTTTTARSQEPKSNPKATNQNTRSPSISTHLAMVELKQKILTSLSKLSDRLSRRHQLALQPLPQGFEAAPPAAAIVAALKRAGQESGEAPIIKREGGGASSPFIVIVVGVFHANFNFDLVPLAS